MNKQEVFEKVAKHLIKQYERSLAVLNCAYRGDNGLRCAIGCLIKDKYYDPDFEGTGINPTISYDSLFAKTLRSGQLQIAIEKSLDSPKLTDNELQLLYSLQKIHDNISPSLWRNKLEEIGGDHSLNTDFLKTCKKDCS